MTVHGKKYKEAAALVDRTKAYEPQEAVELAKKTAHSRFDETVELHLRMGLDPRNASQQVRGVALLPHGLGKKVRVLVFAQGEAERIAEQAGADFVGGDELIKKIEDGWIDFDTTIATPDMMGKVGKLGKILGRRGLMPNPKSGTVTAADNLVKDFPRFIFAFHFEVVRKQMHVQDAILPLEVIYLFLQKLPGELVAALEAVG